jgi:hypothetical protein
MEPIIAKKRFESRIILSVMLNGVKRDSSLILPAISIIIIIVV